MGFLHISNIKIVQNLPLVKFFIGSLQIPVIVGEGQAWTQISCLVLSRVIMEEAMIMKLFSAANLCYIHCLQLFWFMLLQLSLGILFQLLIEFYFDGYFTLKRVDWFQNVCFRVKYNFFTNLYFLFFFSKLKYTDCNQK